MDPFIERFKIEIPDTYPRQTGFLPKLGLCGKLTDGIFHSEDVLISDKLGAKFSISFENQSPEVKEFSFHAKTEVRTAAEFEGRGLIKATEIKGNVICKLLDFNSENSFYYRAILLERKYIPNPIELFKESIMAASKDRKWSNDNVVITSILYGKNPVILKSAAKGISIIGGISSGLSSTANLFEGNAEFKIGFIRNANNGSSTTIPDKNEKVVLGFQMIGLKRRFFQKFVDTMHGDSLDNTHVDIFDDLYSYDNTVNDQIDDTEYILSYV